MDKVEQIIQRMGIDLAIGPEPMANYVSVQKAGNLWFFSGAGPFKDGKPAMFGRLGEDMTKEEGYDAARLAAVNLLAVMKREFEGDWGKLKQIVKLQGFVCSKDDFYEQPAVIDGASDLFVEIFGDRGKHARTAVGTNVIPFRLPLEIEMIIEVR